MPFRRKQVPFRKKNRDLHLSMLVWYNILWYVLTASNASRDQSSPFSFELLKFLVALSQTEPTFHFEVSKAVGFRGKLVRLFIFGNFSSIKTIRSSFKVSENAKVAPQNCSLYSSLCLRTLLQKQPIGQTVYLLPK